MLAEYLYTFKHNQHNNLEFHLTLNMQAAAGDYQHHKKCTHNQNWTELFYDGDSCHIETSQWTDFYIIGTFIIKELKETFIWRWTCKPLLVTTITYITKNAHTTRAELNSFMTEIPVI